MSPMGQKPLRIAICGSAGTGKTTLINELNKALQLTINPVGSRSVAKQMGYDNPYDVDKFGRREEFQFLLMSDKIEWEKNNESFITDRSTFDVLAYTCIHDIQAVNRQLVEMATKGYDRYTHVFWCPMEEFFNVGKDPVRVQSTVYHEAVEVMMCGLIQRYALRFSPDPERVAGNQIELRAADVLEKLKNDGSLD
jgi:predicted ATPase